jgi:transposase-like protein
MKPAHSITSTDVEGLPSRPTASSLIEDLSSSSQASLSQSSSSMPPNPEVNSKPVRRRFTAAYKLRILEEADRCSQAGQIGALLRREGLYSSHLVVWRRQRREGTLSALSAVKRGPKPEPRNPLAGEIDRLRRDNERLSRRLKQAETIIEFQKKVSEILGIPLSVQQEES